MSTDEAFIAYKEERIHLVASLLKFDSYDMRLRVRLDQLLDVEEDELIGTFEGRKLRISPWEHRGKPFAESEWIIFTAEGFDTVQEAASYGLRLQTTLSAVGVLAHWGIDVGPENASAGATDYLRGLAAEGEGIYLAGDAHGVDVHPNGVTRTTFAEGNATGLRKPDRLLQGLEQLAGAADRIDERGRNASLLINAAALSAEGIAKVVLYIAAIELLSSGEKWNDNQIKWLDDTKAALGEHGELTEAEALELSEAFQFLRHLGASAKARRLIKAVGRDDLIPRWNKLYNARSKLFHGEHRMTTADLQGWASEARSICLPVVDAWLRQRLLP